MGDVGSAFLGYTFAILAVIAAQKDPRLALAGVLLVWPFVFDTMFTLLRRLRRGENVFTAHRSHLYQRLVITRGQGKKGKGKINCRGGPILFVLDKRTIIS